MYFFEVGVLIRFLTILLSDILRFVTFAYLDEVLAVVILYGPRRHFWPIKVALQLVVGGLLSRVELTLNLRKHKAWIKHLLFRRLQLLLSLLSHAHVREKLSVVFEALEYLGFYLGRVNVGLDGLAMKPWYTIGVINAASVRIKRLTFDRYVTLSLGVEKGRVRRRRLSYCLVDGTRLNLALGEVPDESPPIIGLYFDV